MMCDIGFSARWGGAEFLIGFDGDLSTMKKMLEEFRETLLEKEFVYEDQVFFVSMTFGVVSYRENEDFASAIKRADELLYHGKENGRNQIVAEDDVRSDDI